jgi:hypothetical protein
MFFGSSDDLGIVWVKRRFSAAANLQFHCAWKYHLSDATQILFGKPAFQRFTGLFITEIARPATQVAGQYRIEKDGQVPSVSDVHHPDSEVSDALIFNQLVDFL